MNYQEHYNTLIERAKNRLLEGYNEKHHIIPICMNGTDDLNNLVSLTPEEHYIAHQLLVKIYPKNNKLIYAVRMMTIESKNHNRNNKLYGWLKRKHSVVVSKAKKGKTYEEMYGIEKATKTKKKITETLTGRGGKNHPLTGIPKKEETKRKISETLTGHLSPFKGKKRPELSGENNGFYGQTHTEESIRKNREAHKGKKRIYRDDGSYYMGNK